MPSPLTAGIFSRNWPISTISTTSSNDVNYSKPKVYRKLKPLIKTDKNTVKTDKVKKTAIFAS